MNNQLTPSIPSQAAKNIKVFKGDLSPQRLSEHLRASEGDYLAADCEMMGLKPARDRLCLVQLCDPDGQVSLIQIGQGQTEAPLLKQLLEAPKVTKVFHYGRTDLAYLHYYLEIAVAPLLCTKIASKLARTYTERHGLRELARELLALDLNKMQQSSDWGRDQLSQDQIEYAAGDVVHLLAIKDKLVTLLKREGRYELAESCWRQVALLAELDLHGYEYVFEHHAPK